MVHIEKYVRDPHEWSKHEAIEQILRYYRGDGIIIFFILNCDEESI